MEYRHITEGEESLITFMKDQNYTLITEVKDRVGLQINVIFAHRNALSMLNMTSLE